MQAWPACLLFISSPAFCFLKHLGSNSAKTSEEKRKPGGLAGLKSARVLLSYLKLAGGFRLEPQEMSQWWLEYFGYTVLPNISKGNAQFMCPLA